MKLEFKFELGWLILGGQAPKGANQCSSVCMLNAMCMHATKSKVQNENPRGKLEVAMAQAQNPLGLFDWAISNAPQW